MDNLQDKKSPDLPDKNASDLPDKNSSDLPDKKPSELLDWILSIPKSELETTLGTLSMPELKNLQSQLKNKHTEISDAYRLGCSKEEFDAFMKARNPVGDTWAYVRFAIGKHPEHCMKHLPGFSGRVGADW